MKNKPERKGRDERRPQRAAGVGTQPLYRPRKPSRQPSPAASAGSGTPISTAKPADIARARAIYQLLLKQYPDAHCALNHRNAFELLVATILSAQCTDVRVNMVTPELFAKYPDAPAFAAAPPGELEQAIRSTGFYRNKAKALGGAGRLLVEKFGGQVPGDMEALLQLPGVARKTANVVLGNAFGKNEGVVVDTHVSRLAQRLGLSRQTDPAKIERDLMALFPREDWTMLAHLLIFHGRQVCAARKPACERCPLGHICPKVGVR
jgi:endonuclease III